MSAAARNGDEEVTPKEFSDAVAHSAPGTRIQYYTGFLAPAADWLGDATKRETAALRDCVQDFARKGFVALTQERLGDRVYRYYATVCAGRRDNWWPISEAESGRAAA